MPNSPRVLTRKKHRKLTHQQLYSLLAEYATTDITMKAVGKKYGISKSAVSQIVRNFYYPDPRMAGLRKIAQQKANARLARFSSAKSVRVPDFTMTVLEIDPTNIEAIDAAILRLLHERSTLVGAAVEVCNG